MDRSKIWEKRSWHWNYHDQFPENRATEQPGSDGHRTMNGTWHTAFVVCCPERPWTVTASAESHKASFFMQHQIIQTWICFIMMLSDKTMWAFWARNSKHDLVRVRVTRFSFGTKDAKYIQISQFCEHGLAQSVPAPKRSWLQTWRSGLRPRLIHVFSATKVMPVPMNCKAFWPDIWPEASSGGQRGITSRMVLERCHVEHDMWCRESLLCLATPVHRAHTSKPTKLPGFLVTLLSVNYLLIAWTMKIMKIHVPFAEYHGRNVFCG